MKLAVHVSLAACPPGRRPNLTVPATAVICVCPLHLR